MHSRKTEDIYFPNAALKSLKKILRYVNEVLFEMVKSASKYTYLGGTTPTELENEVSIFRKIYYNKENRFMVNQSVNELCTRLCFKIDALT